MQPVDVAGEAAKAAPGVVGALAALRWMPGTPLQRPWPPADDPSFIALHTAMMNALVADTDRPKPPAWGVAPNGKYPDRPTYPVADGKRSTKSDGRAKVGAACACASPIVEGKTTYCPVPPSASVAVCARAP